MSNKIGRNEPCWCGSGRKYKHCHLRRERESRPTRQEALRALTQNRKYCLHPLASNDTCEGGIVRAHTIQRSGGLSRIAQNGHVYMPTFMFGTADLAIKRVGVRKATAFTGFCNKHDTHTFRPVETVPFESNEENCFLLGYRAICHELYKKRAVGEQIDNFLSTADRGLKVSEQMVHQDLLDAYKAGTTEAIKDLEFFKKQYDKALLSQDYSEVRFYVIRFNDVPDILCSLPLLPEIDFNGRILQDLYKATLQKKRLAYFTFSLTTTDTGGAAVFSWLGDNGPPMSFVESLADYGDEEIPHALLRLTFEFAENTVISPVWWDKLPEQVKSRLVKRLSAVFDFSTVRDRDCLVDDGVRAVEWIVDCRETNMSF